ncbi:transcription-repair coupling factor [Snodgrassella alvi]|uniref:Transcription-repair-coupling factor n=1 Tax=Snodgrassella alvi TaxID=1196083 RepID=A0A2N9X5Y1_9NEIS|nr:transcription-repair coupling factor [Snodgrassella alvi]PIT38584.1 transcription-repair coupling factor [Snodgrassella alvi]
MSAVAPFALPKSSQIVHWPDLNAGSLPFLLSKHLPEKKLKIVLTADAEQAIRIQTAWQFFNPAARIVFFPDWETLPYEHFSPHQELVSERLSTLWQLKNGLVDVLLLPLATAMQKIAPPSFLLGRTFWLKTGQQLDTDALKHSLIEAGYNHVTHVVATGEFATRGGILDIFPMGSDTPFRLDLFDNEIDTIKTFDADTQRTLNSVEEIRLLPAHEFPTDSDAQKIFRSRFREEISSDPRKATVYEAVSEGHFGAGVEYYLPLFFEEECVSIFDYINEDAILVNLGDIHNEAARIWQDVKQRYTMAQGDPAYPPLAPHYLYMSEDQIGARIKTYARVVPELSNHNSYTLPDVAVDRQSDDPLHSLKAFLQQWSGKVLICAESLGRRETMLNFMREYQLQPHIVSGWADFLQAKAELCLTIAPLSYGCLLDEQRLAIITEADLYQYVVRGRRTRRKHSAVSDGMLRDLAEIKIGDPVVHEQHGIGRYQGLVTLDLGEGASEMMLLEYAEGSQLYVPVSQLQLISRYAGSAHENVSLHKLGHGAWDKARHKAAEKARDTAAELLNLYARREAQQGHRFSLNEIDYQAFANGFGYEETEDQAAAIAATLKDLCAEKPMDRLICGDVGFGKTEVALRAAFVAAMAGKQVVVLAPTTLLVEQHAQNFADRFADFPIKVAQLSRFNTSKQTQATLAGLADGTVDIVIGTHKLVQPDVHFKNLGLVIIDEEHRFGVRQKEQLKSLRANVDVLTLTATPIPRTLSMALEGLRDFSLITTAPSRRLAVKTFVRPLSDGLIREAVMRELKRGGQVFFLHNEVDTIANAYEKLSSLLPEARIGIAHGQLRERELEQVMRDFLQQRYNVLLCSTIIETGIDIPNANTIIIERADKFGLAQLHQLRGRVGRSHHQAYAYLLVPEAMTKDAQKRLEAIEMADDLGAGFTLAMQDLEIRGAGEILGEGQSGEMIQVGFTLYTEMLKQAVRNLKKGREPDLDAPLGITSDIKLHSPALLPESYCPDIHARLVLYKRLASSETEAEIDQIHEELIDRFGLLEPAVSTLIASHHLRLEAANLGIDTIDASSESITFTFGKHHRINPAIIVAMMQNDKNYRLVGADKLRVNISIENVQQRVQIIKNIMKQLAVDAS